MSELGNEYRACSPDMRVRVLGEVVDRLLKTKKLRKTKEILPHVLSPI